MRTIDINCDMGEGIGNDEELMPYISSASIACGYHAGDENTMKQTVELCKKYNVAIGAHPSFPDREHFGRIDLLLPHDEVYELVKKQILSLQKIADDNGATVHHVKAHGALYNMAARDKALAAVIALAVKDANSDLLLFGLSGSHLIREAKNIGIKTVNETFADRAYNDDKSLASRSKPGALVETADKAVAQVLQMVNEGTVTSISGKKISIVAETVCVHGDGEHAIEFAKAIHQAFKENNIAIKARS
jgi:UPF0271 protein